MAVKTDLELKQYFETNDVPTQQQYFDLIDSKQNVGAITPAMAIGATVVSGTVGSVLFIGGGGVLQQNNANFFWDNTNKRLGLGTIVPNSRVHLSGDTNADPKPLQIRYERPAAGVYNSNTTWISNVASQGLIDVGFQSLAQQAVGQGTRWSWATTNNSLVNATESMRLSQEKRLSIGSVINNGATVDVFSAGLLSTDLCLRVRNNGNTFDDFKVNGAGQTLIGNITALPQLTALCQMDSVTRGLLIPRMSTVQRNAILLPATGLQIYNITTNTIDYFNGVSWFPLSSSGGTFQLANLTTVQRNLLPLLNGTLIWNTTTDQMEVYKTSAGAWRKYTDLP
jgi:hypothetical protein